MISQKHFIWLRKVRLLKEMLTFCSPKHYCRIFLGFTKQALSWVDCHRVEKFRSDATGLWDLYQPVMRIHLIWFIPRSNCSIVPNKIQIGKKNQIWRNFRIRLGLRQYENDIWIFVAVFNVFLIANTITV